MLERSVMTLALKIHNWKNITAGSKIIRRKVEKKRKTRVRIKKNKIKPCLEKKALNKLSGLNSWREFIYLKINDL